MDWRLEVVPVPVSDIDAAKDFYRRVGFRLDHDVRPTEQLRIVQLTPPGSACSIVLGVVDSPPGSLRGLQLVVTDIEAARAELVERGVEVSEVTRLAPGDGGAFLFFSDPDGNSWNVQEIRGEA
ncbi:MAG TPA: VOC family protein [Jatrophihabitans sp.]|jgi:predicted enzyme related to lactoylglutathione lyase|nr:VOC family protein [Jatrophihabitans sp.]